MVKTEEILSYESLAELISDLKRLKKIHPDIKLRMFPIQPVRVGNKIGFVNWETYKIECVPIFDQYDREFTSYDDNICVRKGNKWGVINGLFKVELPISYSYSVAKQVCREINCQVSRIQTFRKYGAYIRVS